MSEETAATSDDWVSSLQEALRLGRTIEEDADSSDVPTGAGAEPGHPPTAAPKPSIDEAALRATVARAVAAAMTAAAQRRPPATADREAAQLEELLDRFSQQLEATVGRISADAWDDMQVVTKELRSRVDDLEEQQKRALRELAEWRADLDERLAALPSEITRRMERDTPVEAPRFRIGR